MADSFFGFDTSYSNLNDDEGGGEPSEDEYDALNDETFGQDSEVFDWEVQHEQLAEELESNRRNAALDEADSRLEASLSQLVLDDNEAPQTRSLGSSVWRHDLSFSAPTPIPPLKNVCTVEELERQLRQNQNPQNFTQNYFQPRFPPVILRRPPGLQAPVPLPFAPQQPMAHNMNQMNQPLNKIIGQNTQMNQMGQNQMMNHMTQNINQMGQNMSHGPNQMPQNMNQMSQSMNQMPQSMNQMPQSMNQLSQNINLQQNVNQMGQMSHNVNQFMQNSNQMNQFQNNQMGQGIMNQMPNMHHQNNQMVNQMGQMNQSMNQNLNQMQNQMPPNMNQMGQNINQMGSNMNQMGPNINRMGQNMNQMGQGMNHQMGQNMNQMGQNMNQMGQNQMMPNGNNFGMNQFPHMMGQPRMMAPPPGIGMPRQNFSPNMNQFNPNFRGPSIPKNDQPNQPNMIINQMNKQMNQPINPPMNQQMNQPMNQQMNQPMNQPMNQQMNQPIKPNQMNQSQNKLQKPIQNVTQPLQNQKLKTRVYNNSKSLTSQNMVQIIQNTHPMLQFNNSYHNASHHPMLNNRNLFNNQVMNNHPMFNRQNGSFGNANRNTNSDDSASDTDEYAGLMTQREKQWLINIQMLQLNTGTPYIHDFYYTVFLERQANKEKEGIKEAHKANQQNHPFYSGAVKQEPELRRERHNSLRHNSTSDDAPRAYVPTQFENSLGKLQCGSVTAPRKIIDVELVAEPASGRQSRAPSVASTTNPAEVPREVRRTKQLLLDIESLYIILLRLEELNDPLAISNALILKEREEKQKQLEAAQKEAENDLEDDSNLFLKNIESVQRRPKQDSPKSECIDKRQVVNLAVCTKPAPVKNLLDEDKDELLNKMFSGLLHGDRLPQMLTVRKGRSLVVRFLRRAPTPHGRLRALWSRVLRALPSASRRDDGGLAALSHHYRRYIQNTTGWSAVIESCGILSEAIDPARTPHALTTSLTLSCVCALMERAIILVNTPDATSNERQWYKFLKTLARALKHTTLIVAKPVQPLPESKVLHHIKQLESRSTIEILQRGKTADFDLTKTEVTETLVRHLC